MFHSLFSADVDILMDTAEAKVINPNVLELSRKGEAGLCLDGK